MEEYTGGQVLRLPSRFRCTRDIRTALPSPRSPLTSRVSSTGAREERRFLQTSRILRRLPVLEERLSVETVHARSCVGSRKGVDKKVNQDQWFEGRWEQARFVGVCDGHGSNGHLVSQLLADSTPSLIRKRLSSLLPEAVLSAVYQDLSSLISSSALDTRTSGSTCLTVLITPTLLVCANVGDSRAVLGRCLHGTWSVHQLSWDHRPDSLSETQRIVAAGGEVSVSKLLHSGPARVYLKNQLLPGLSVSRTFGDDYAAGSGVISEPDVTTVQLTARDKFLVLGSDGLWEVLSSMEAVRLAGGLYRTQPELVCGRLIEEAQRRWSKKGSSMDDITVLFLVFSAG